MVDLPRILVINPNSTESVTESIRNAAAIVPRAEMALIDCVTLATGPPGIETDEHVRQVIEPLMALVRRERPNSAAVVVACFSDPGLSDLRAVTDLPLFGLGECSYRAAASSRLRFGVISILAEAIPRHRLYISSLGLSGWLAGELPLGLGVTELADETRVGGRLEETGRLLRDKHGAETLILGCAGMAPYRNRLEATLDLPVIEPCQTAVAAALEAVFPR